MDNEKSKGERQQRDEAQSSGAAAFSLPALPFAPGDLAPAISARTIDFHYGKHHKGYVDKLNKLVEGTPYAAMELDEVVRKTAKDPRQKAIFNNAAQAWNHTFYWNSLSPQTSDPSAALTKAIVRDFGDVDSLRSALAKKAAAHFGSGWAWLVLKGDALAIVDTHDADTPMAHGTACLLTIDVWEHAYYLDRQNERKAYVQAVTEGLLNWKFASANFERASS